MNQEKKPLVKEVFFYFSELKYYSTIRVEVQLISPHAVSNLSKHG